MKESFELISMCTIIDFPQKSSIFFSDFWIRLPGPFYYFNGFVYYKDATHREYFPLHKPGFSDNAYFRRNLILNARVFVPNPIFKRCLLTEHNK